MKDYASAQQNFVMMVSLFGHRRGFVYASEGMENQHQSEQQVVQQMLATLDLEGMVVTADVLHCKKNGRLPAPAKGLLPLDGEGESTDVTQRPETGE